MQRAALGIPEDAFVFLGSHQTMKITRGMLTLWMSILAEAPGSVLLLNRHLPRTIIALARSYGVELERLFMFKWVRTELEHLSRIGVADLYLDTYPFCSAGLTAIDAMVMGVPRVTLATENLYSRFGKVLLNALGLQELVCSTPEEYKEQVLRLYRDRLAFRRIRNNVATALETAAAALNPELLLSQVEVAIEQMVAEKQAGRPARDFDIRVSAAGTAPRVVFSSMTS
jgi:predicted O-linked N-acetylglucosamine transferase (SPINDLY family)